MYKKLTCAFCLVISIFLLAVVIYLFRKNTDWFSDKPPELTVPKISLYLINETGHEMLLHSRSNSGSEYILDYLKLMESDEEESNPNYHHEFSPIILRNSHSHLQQFSRRRLRIRCHSNYPVQLKYSGFGNLTEVKNYNRRQIQDFADRSSYVFTTELEFSNVDEGITGKYECQVRDDQGELLADSFLFIYAAGSKTFVSHSARELISEPGSLVEVPCPVSHPSKTITLISEQLTENATIEREVERERIHHYDPRLGFTLHPGNYNYGWFYCRDEKTLEASGRVTVFLPLNQIVKGRSLRLSSQNVDDKDGKLKLECRAKEPVELKFYNFIKFKREQKEVTNDSQEYPYSVRIKLERSWFGGNVSVVHCQTKRDRRVIRMWKFLKEDVPKELITPRVILQQFGKEKVHGYQCCSNRSSLHPILRTYPCQTPTECELRKPCLSIDPLRTTPSTESCPLLSEANEAIYQNGENCTLLRVEGNSSGIIRCLLDSASKDYAYVTGREVNMDGMYPVYSSMTLVSLGKRKVEPEEVLKISKLYRSTNQKVVRFECQGSKLLFASGFQWGIEKSNEPIKYLTNKGVSIESDSVLHNEWIDISFTDNTNRKFYCFAPLINPPLYGPQWINVSITF